MTYAVPIRIHGTPIPRNDGVSHKSAPIRTYFLTSEQMAAPRKWSKAHTPSLQEMEQFFADDEPKLPNIRYLSISAKSDTEIPLNPHGLVKYLSPEMATAIWRDYLMLGERILAWEEAMT